MISKILKFIGYSISTILVIILSSLLWLVEINNSSWINRISFEFVYFPKDDQCPVVYSNLWAAIKAVFRGRVFESD